MVRPVTPPDDGKQTESQHVAKDKQSYTNMPSNNSSSIAGKSTSTASKPLDRKIIVSGNPETLLTKLFENVEEKVTPKRPEAAATGANYKTPVPPSCNIRRGR